MLREMSSRATSLAKLLIIPITLMFSGSIVQAQESATLPRELRSLTTPENQKKFTPESFLNLSQAVGKSASEDAQALLVVMGGWNTCRNNPDDTNLYRRAARMIPMNSSSSAKFRVLASCFGSIAQNVYFITPSEPDVVYEGTNDQFLTAVQNEARHTQTRVAYFIGHSHGGWLAMRTALKISTDVLIQGLVTLDPISRVNCIAKTFIPAYLRSITGVDPAPGCTESPSDFDHRQLSSIGNRVRWWQNFYQLESYYLHSSDIVEAENRYIDFNLEGIFDIFGPHIRIATDGRAWMGFERLIRELL